MTLKQGRRIIFDLFQANAIHHQRRKIIKAVHATENDPVSHAKACRFYGVSELSWWPREAGK